MNKEGIKAFIKSAINQRKTIIRRQRSLKDNKLIKEHIKFLETYAPGLNTTPRAARFFILHYAKIELLLPPNRVPEAYQMLLLCKSINQTSL